MALALFNSGRKLLSMKNTNRDEDLTSKLFGTATPVAIFILVVFISPRQFFNSPITCWQMNSFFSSYASYAERKCLVSGTYYVPEDEFVETFTSEKKLRWYPFTTIFIAMNALPFIIITLIWNGFNSQGGIEVTKVSEAARSYQNLTDHNSNQEREEILHYICENLNLVQKDKNSYVMIQGLTQGQRKITLFCNKFFNCFSRFNDSYLANLTLCIKIMYILAVPFNFFLISSFIGSGFWTLGFRFFFRIGSGQSVFFKEMFPLQTMCEFNVRTNMQIETKKLQCLLTMNIFNEKVFLIIWYWYIFLIVVGIVNLISWIAFRLSSKYRYDYLKQYVPTPKTKRDTMSLHDFFANFLTPDCSFALRLIMHHVDHLTMTILTTGLYNLHKAEVAKVTLNQNIDNHDSDISDDEMHPFNVDDENLDQLNLIANGF